MPKKKEPSDEAKAIGLRVREARKRKGLTQVALAESIGAGDITQVTISAYELGHIEEPSAIKFAALASALGVDMEWLTVGTLPRARRARRAA